MSVTNAISSVIIVGAIIAALANDERVFLKHQIFLVFGNYSSSCKYFWWVLVTQRMLQMYKKEKENNLCQPTF